MTALARGAGQQQAFRFTESVWKITMPHVRSIVCSDTEALFHSRAVSRIRNVERVARKTQAPRQREISPLIAKPPSVQRHGDQGDVHDGEKENGGVQDVFWVSECDAGS